MLLNLTENIFSSYEKRSVA